MILKRLWAGHKLTRAKKYCQRRASELYWMKALKCEELTFSEYVEIECLKEAAHILWALEWMV